MKRYVIAAGVSGIFPLIGVVIVAAVAAVEASVPGIRALVRGRHGPAS